MKEALIETTDDRCHSTNWDKKYHVILSSFISNRSSVKPSEFTIYTEGSKTDYEVGGGFVIYNKRDIIHTNRFSLQDTTTVFQAKITAL